MERDILHWFCIALVLLLIGCAGCPEPNARRADLPPDRAAGELRIVLERNIIAQVNAFPPLLIARVAGATPAKVRFSVYAEAGNRVIEKDVPREPDGLYKFSLTLPGNKPLGAGIYRLHAALTEQLETSFEVRPCTVFY